MLARQCRKKNGDYFACYERCERSSPVQGNFPASLTEAEVASETQNIGDALAPSQGEVPGFDATEPPVTLSR